VGSPSIERFSARARPDVCAAGKAENVLLAIETDNAAAGETTWIYLLYAATVDSRCFGGTT
jgi:hypothetical protein